MHQISVKHYRDLTKEELYSILELRESVFIVEQDCPYHDLDRCDDDAYHFCIWEDGALIGYLRLQARLSEKGSARIGRIIVTKRRCGIGTELVRHAMRYAKDELEASSAELEAQTYVRSLYDKLGFVQTSEEFLLDGIPHIRMECGL